MEKEERPLFVLSEKEYKEAFDFSGSPYRHDWEEFCYAAQDLDCVRKAIHDTTFLSRLLCFSQAPCKRPLEKDILETWSIEDAPRLVSSLAEFKAYALRFLINKELGWKAMTDSENGGCMPMRVFAMLLGHSCWLQETDTEEQVLEKVRAASNEYPRQLFLAMQMHEGIRSMSDLFGSKVYLQIHSSLKEASTMPGFEPLLKAWDQCMTTWRNLLSPEQQQVAPLTPKETPPEEKAQKKEEEEPAQLAEADRPDLAKKKTTKPPPSLLAASIRLMNEAQSTERTMLDGTANEKIRAIFERPQQEAEDSQ